ncbi:hypothetical protein [Ensifer sesbaniae]|uniref:hypothetical protein n=1 Tax=Ensifer sesbaniae TaxID=1214071 RepID=UPI0015690D3B|nr:hypothetical protein [Ensifer sesbaniae]NRQ13485.1 hypothetical protein [Ensifer sesbaniae]
MMWQWLSQLQGAQASLIGSFAGFVFGVFALIIGAWVNFSLNRKRDALLRSEEADAVASALLSEMILLRAELGRVANIVAYRVRSNERFDKHFLEHVQLPDPILFTAFASKLGILDPKICFAITDFYSKLQLVRSWLPLLVENEERRFSYNPLAVLEPAVEAIDGLEETLATISTKLKVAPPVRAFDIGKARDTMEYEKERVENQIITFADEI